MISEGKAALRTLEIRDTAVTLADPLQPLFNGLCYWRPFAVDPNRCGWEAPRSRPAFPKGLSQSGKLRFAPGR